MKEFLVKIFHGAAEFTIGFALRGQTVHWHGQVFKHVKTLSERSKESKEQKKNKASVLVAESAYNAQNAQFGLVMTHAITF